MTEPLISIVLLSYNRPALLREALESARAQTQGRLEIIVVDNPSPSSEEVERVAGRYPGVRLIRNQENEGFAGGMNRGIEAAKGEYVYLTEDDIVLDPDCLRLLLEYAEAHDDSGLVSPVMYNKAAGTVRCAGGEFTLGGVYRKEIHGVGARGATEGFTNPFDVTYVVGANVFARTDFLRRLGGFREEFFMYVEDLELCARVLATGRRMTVVPGARVHHFEPPEDARAAPQLEFHKLKNFFALYLLHAPARVLPEFFFRYALLNTLRAIAGRGGDARITLRALCWLTKRAPALLSERRRGVAPEHERASVDEGRALDVQTNAATARELSRHTN
jgi:GT2 family glycosyltransferase